MAPSAMNPGAPEFQQEQNYGAVEELDENDSLMDENDLSPYNESADNVVNDDEFEHAHLRTQEMDQEAMDQIQMDQIQMEQQLSAPVADVQVNHFQVQGPDESSDTSPDLLTSNSDSNNNQEPLVQFGPENRPPIVFGHFSHADLFVEEDDMNEFQRQIRLSFVDSVRLLHQRLGIVHN